MPDRRRHQCHLLAHWARCRCAIALPLLLWLVGCAPFPESRVEVGSQAADTRFRTQALEQSAAPASTPSPTSPTPSSAGSAFYAPGSERFTSPRSTSPSPSPTGSDVTLNFDNTSLLEVVQVILSDLLGQSYVVAPGVGGSVTLQSARPIPRDALMGTLEMLLRMNGAALVRDGANYRIVPREQALSSGVTPQLGDSARPIPVGFSVQVIPLRYIAASEMRDILEPLVDPDSVVRVDTVRNMLVLAGSGTEMTRLIETVDVFDVDWMAGMSVAMFTPEFVDVKTLASELEQALGTADDGPASGLIRFVPIERLNGLLVITPRRTYLERARQWIERLDRAGIGVGRRLFVYHVQNGKAADLADVLTQVFQIDAQRVPAAEVAPGLTPTQVGGRGGTRGNDARESASASNRNIIERTLRSSDDTSASQANDGASESTRVFSAQRVPTPGEGVEVTENGDVRIIADEINNALVILATASEYKQVEAALRRLDIAPLQVLIEATIAEVQLSDELSQGLEWFLKNNFGSKRGTALLDGNDTAGLAALVPGFSYSITDAAQVVRAVLNTLASQSRARVVSSPSLMVLNNQQATIRVGDEVPVTTQQQQSTSTNSNIVNSIEFRETGVSLSVTPRVNAGGLVTMEVEQEVSDVVANAASPLTPTIQQRTISSTVAVQSGETVVLGGLIRERDNATDTGVPGVREVPVLGWFFGSRNDSLTRTELVVLITPRAVRGAVQARELTQEFRDKMDSLKPADRAPRGFGPWYHRLEKLEQFFQDSGATQSPEAQQQGRALNWERTLDPKRPSRASLRPEPQPKAPVALSLDGGQGRGGS